MAALGTIRKRGVILVCIISFGLFAFIAEEAFRSCDSAKNNERQQIGEVLGEKISVQDFQKLVDEYSEVIKMQQGQENLPEEQMNQVNDFRSLGIPKRAFRHLRQFEFRRHSRRPGNNQTWYSALRT